MRNVIRLKIILAKGSNVVLFSYFLCFISQEFKVLRIRLHNWFKSNYFPENIRNLARNLIYTSVTGITNALPGTFTWNHTERCLHELDDLLTLFSVVKTSADPSSSVSLLSLSKALFQWAAYVGCILRYRQRQLCIYLPQKRQSHNTLQQPRCRCYNWMLILNIVM